MDMQHPDARTASAEADREGGSGCDQVEHREHHNRYHQQQRR